MSVLDDILTDDLFQRASRCERSIRVVAPPIRSYRSKQARRAAFYSRQRLSRVVQRFVRIQSDSWRDSIEQAQRDMIATGIGVMQVERVEPRRDIDPLTGEPWAHPWRVRTLTRAEFEREFPRHVGVDFAEGFEPPAGA